MNTKGVVYFIKVAGYIKVGYTCNFASRFDTIERMMPETPQVLATIEAPRAVEATIHRRLRGICLKNEWYYDCEEVRAALADALAGEIPVTGRADSGEARDICPNVKWASEALAKIAEPVGRDESYRAIIQRVATRIGLSYWRTFDLWYAKARRLGIEEHAAILAALPE